ncbi:MAG: hypothetical protein ACPGEG_08240 [Salibacteraceae bacterium]
MFYSRIAGKKKDELDEWFADELFPILISGDKLAVQSPVKKEPVVVVKSDQQTQAQASRPNLAPTTSTKTIKKIRKGSLKSGIDTGMLSIKSLLNESTKDGGEEEIEDFSDRPRTPYTEVEFKTVWQDYIELLKTNKRASMMSTLSSCHPEFQDNFKLNMIFDNIVQEAEFLNEKSALLGHLREKLQNWGIHIVTEVREVAQKKKYYSNRERFERMAELNPKLELLRSRLNLDPDY